MRLRKRQRHKSDLRCRSGTKAKWVRILNTCLPTCCNRSLLVQTGDENRKVGFFQTVEFLRGDTLSGHARLEGKQFGSLRVASIEKDGLLYRRMRPPYCCKSREILRISSVENLFEIFLPSGRICHSNCIVLRSREICHKRILKNCSSFAIALFHMT